jgi:anti-sigma regulatory factor (Ser/Thr protein kinase)
VTESVTNAAVHASTMIELSILLRPDDLMIRVADGSLVSPATPSALPAAMGSDAGAYGLGLRIVSALAMDWGFRLEDDGKVVWATLVPGKQR